MSLRAGPDLLLRSSTPGIRWPAPLAGAPASALALQFQLSRSERWSPERLLDAQLVQLGELTRYAAAHVPWYQKRFRRWRVDPGGPWTVERWRQVPPLRRKDVQDAGAALHARHVPAEHGRVGVARTSGSTGRPVEVLKSELNIALWRAITLREHLWHERDFSGMQAQIRYIDGDRALPPYGARQSGWGPSVDAVFHAAPGALLDIRASTEEQLDWLLREDPHYLLTYPSALAALLDAATARGVRVPRLREVRTVSEMLRPDLRERCAQVLGVPLVDCYSTQELGYLALQCPEHPHYHVQSETMLVEVLDDDGRPCVPGEVGRVVVTPLHAFAMPLLRYEVGDLAEVGEPCPCGRGLPVLRRVLGRVRNMLRFPDGRRVWPLFTDHRFRELAPIRQWQVVQTALDTLVMHVVADAPLTDVQQRQLAALLTERLGWPFRVSFVQHERLERGPSGKFEDFRCELPD